MIIGLPFISELDKLLPNIRATLTSYGTTVMSDEVLKSIIATSAPKLYPHWYIHKSTEVDIDDNGYYPLVFEEQLSRYVRDLHVFHRQPFALCSDACVIEQQEHRVVIATIAQEQSIVVHYAVAPYTFKNDDTAGESVIVPDTTALALRVAADAIKTMLYDRGRFDVSPVSTQENAAGVQELAAMSDIAEKAYMIYASQSAMTSLLTMLGLTDYSEGASSGKQYSEQQQNQFGPYIPSRTGLEQ